MVLLAATNRRSFELMHGSRNGRIYRGNKQKGLFCEHNRPKVYRAQGWIATLAQPTATQIIDIESTQTTASDASEEAEVRELVENFGGRLQLVSLLAPTAAQDLQQQYSEFVSPTLLETWMSDVSKAPGRMVSSPWPDRIEITTLTEEAPDRYVIDGSVVKITSAEIDSGEAANKIPVQIIVEKAQGNWLITEYAQEQ